MEWEHNCPDGARLYPLARVVWPRGARTGRLEDHTGATVLQRIRFCPWCGAGLGGEEGASPEIDWGLCNGDQFTCPLKTDGGHDHP
jgi:hypothetical protein